MTPANVAVLALVSSAIGMVLAHLEDRTLPFMLNAAVFIVALFLIAISL